jgi:hypothetical protein
MKLYPPILFILGFLVASSAHAEEARIRNLTATSSRGAVAVSFTLENAFDRQEILGALESGLATGFTYHVELIRKKKNWFDDTLQTAHIEVISTYNSVTREYLLNYRRDKLLVRSEVFSNVDDLKRRMTTIAEETLFDLGGKPHRRLVVRARADLMRGYLLYVVPWDVSTNWSVTRVKAQNGTR